MKDQHERALGCREALRLAKGDNAAALALHGKLGGEENGTDLAMFTFRRKA
jgi:hypothetical protein